MRSRLASVVPSSTPLATYVTCGGLLSYLIRNTHTQSTTPAGVSNWEADHRHSRGPFSCLHIRIPVSKPSEPHRGTGRLQTDDVCSPRNLRSRHAADSRSHVLQTRQGPSD